MLQAQVIQATSDDGAGMSEAEYRQWRIKTRQASKLLDELDSIVRQLTRREPLQQVIGKR